jgi:hypothetical protein
MFNNNGGYENEKYYFKKFLASDFRSGNMLRGLSASIVGNRAGILSIPGKRKYREWS